MDGKSRNVTKKLCSKEKKKRKWWKQTESNSLKDRIIVRDSNWWVLLYFLIEKKSTENYLNKVREQRIIYYYCGLRANIKNSMYKNCIKVV